MFSLKLRQVAAAALAVTSLVVASRAMADPLTSDSPEYMGYYDNPEPASAADEAGYINFLAGLAPGTSDTEDASPPPGSIRTYNRSNNALCYPTCTAAVAGGAVKDESGSGDVNLDGDWLYLIGKYDGPSGGSMVWYVADLDGMWDIPTSGPEDLTFGLSHWTLFNPDGNGGGPGNGNGNGGGPGNGNGGGVPEPATLALVGAGLLAAVGLRRRRLTR